jgi:hypothetical protein
MKHYTVRQIARRVNRSDELRLTTGLRPAELPAADEGGPNFGGSVVKLSPA